jgi:hypothetical protein
LSSIREVLSHLARTWTERRTRRTRARSQNNG